MIQLIELKNYWDVTQEIIHSLTNQIKTLCKNCILIQTPLLSDRENQNQRTHKKSNKNFMPSKFPRKTALILDDQNHFKCKICNVHFPVKHD